MISAWSDPSLHPLLNTVHNEHSALYCVFAFKRFIEWHCWHVWTPRCSSFKNRTLSVRSVTDLCCCGQKRPAVWAASIPLKKPLLWWDLVGVTTEVRKFCLISGGLFERHIYWRTSGHPQYNRSTLGNHSAMMIYIILKHIMTTNNAIYSEIVFYLIVSLDFLKIMFPAKQSRTFSF